MRRRFALRNSDFSNALLEIFLLRVEFGFGNLEKFERNETLMRAVSGCQFGL